MAEVESRSYTAVFTLTMPAGTTDEEWADQLAYMSEMFDVQWAQTGNTDMGWTVTIHADDRVDG